MHKLGATRSTCTETHEKCNHANSLPFETISKIVYVVAEILSDTATKADLITSTLMRRSIHFLTRPPISICNFCTLLSIISFCLLNLGFFGLYQSIVSFPNVGEEADKANNKQQRC